MRGLVKLGLVLTAAATIGTIGAGCSKKSSSSTATPTATATPPLGPGAGLTCSSGKNAYATYGSAGFEAVNASIFTITDRVLASSSAAKLGGSFGLIGTGSFDGLSTFQGKLLAFDEWAFGGPATLVVNGTSFNAVTISNNMQAEHTGLGITTTNYTTFLDEVLIVALTTNGVSSADVGACLAPVVTNSAFEASIIGH